MKACCQLLQILVNYENGKLDENPSSVNHADQLVDEQSLVMINFSCYYPNQLPPMVICMLLDF